MTPERWNQLSQKHLPLGPSPQPADRQEGILPSSAFDDIDHSRHGLPSYRICTVSCVRRDCTLKMLTVTATLNTATIALIDCMVARNTLMLSSLNPMPTSHSRRAGTPA